ncbi:flagellar hook-associated protein FlgL [Thiorhodovibrio frisius]|uniref:Flagellar hook-associated protein 3 n=1 Tax=Thiorhodovibrio frisius TaxID=631362 RepID=H8YZQ2_9GAMM|nr:flagellar hook-associated protein FlgL [Thiorhodovibrio frisius]EIC22179.1 flagellar hook-associated protein 3 [Thiorhodovibrio frisius]WPL24473.1 Hook-filament junction protein [Thiorhodovibrio frisius]
MRISTEQIFRSGTESMQRAQSELNQTGMQLSTGKRILTASDDPAGATQSAQFREIIQSIEQFQRNTDLAQPRLQQEEWAIAGVSDQLQRVRELMIQGANDSQTNETRGFMAREIREIRDSIFDVSNTKDPNGEYLFAGTESLATPFEIDGNNVISYVGADGEGSVREVAITPIRKVAIGDNGADVFMNITENDGRVSADVNRAAATPRGSLVIEKTEVSNLDDFLTGTNATDEFEISFQTDPVTGNLQYQVENKTAGGFPIAWTDYSSGSPVEFAGRTLVLSGDPNVSDTVTSRPANNVSLFQTLDAIATAFETPVGGSSSRADLTNAVNRGIADIDASFNHLSEVRATVGTRLQVIDDQTELNEGRKLDLRSTLSELEDLDYAEAISRFKFQQVALEAAQQSYVQVNRLSLFNFI